MNEIDRYAAAWLRNLWPEAFVDERSICDLAPGDIVGERAHFFAGIGGWEYALQLAGWPPDWPVWTGSCPCQPFSAAGRAGGVLDSRHLWPAFRGLIAECRPPVIFGEQVASKAGRAWLAGVRTDLEALGYAVGVADLCAAGVGAPHIRQRLFWVADAQRGPAERQRLDVAGTTSTAQGEARERQRIRPDPGSGRDAVRLGAPNRTRSQGRDERGDGADQRTPWASGVAIPCADGKARRVEPGIRPLAHGSAFALGSGGPLDGKSRVGMLRAYGNCIVPQVAAEFIRAFMETR